MNLSRSAILAASLLVACFPVYAETLFGVYQHAKHYDPQVKVELENYSSAQSLVEKAKKELGVQISLSSSASLATSDRTGSSSGQYHDQFNAQYSINISKPVYNKALLANVAEAEATAKQAQLVLKAAQQNLMKRVAEPYFDALLAQEKLRFAQAEQQAIGKQLEQAKAYFNAGTLAMTDVKEAQARYDQSLSAVIDASHQIQLAKEALRVVSGKTYTQLQGSSTQVKSESPAPKSIDAWVKVAERNNKNLLIARQAIDVAEKNLIEQRAVKKATVDLYANHSASFMDGISDNLVTANHYDNSIGLNLHVPLYGSGMNEAMISNARHVYASVQHSAEYERQIAYQQVRSAYLSVSTDISQINAFQKELSSNQTALEATEAGFKVGTRTAVDVLLALRNRFRSQLDLSQARYHYLIHFLSLKQAAGTLSESDLQNISNRLSGR